MYQIKIENLDKMNKGFLRGAKQTRNILKRAMQKSLVATTNISKASAPVKTGRLRRSIHNVMKNIMHGEVSTATEYAKFVELGTRAHAITPKKAKVLAFKVDGRMVFAKRVWHPGTKGQFYMKHSTQKASVFVRNFYEQAAQEIKQMVTGSAI
jgi:hypothetical protein